MSLGFAYSIIMEKAWSTIVHSLIPNIGLLETHLGKFCDIWYAIRITVIGFFDWILLSEADEVVLFEKATFLVISHVNKREHPDVHRFEKVSNIIKQFKLSCR